ncbi:MATE family efflux transporter [Ornithinimicrobium avium]|uniref:Uncharacterized protein n=1 Tax=Ornithinimicrobium avium TaxID=2283195 RepID=A0A345NPB2_9MICO|nr:polysaccharide biosynthesis C-terminal domain-containing protein [Ornithinimicrobium avium]AXH96870.1 hypothetical protein DV701_12765 [Ornithinimicrobium avium]
MGSRALLRGGLLYAARVSYGALLLAASIIIARLYGPYGLGVYALLLTLTNLGGILGVFGMNTLLLERLPRLRMRADADRAVGAYLRSLLGVVTLTGALATTLCALVAWYIVPELFWASGTVMFMAWSTLFLSFLVSEHRQVMAASLESVLRPALFVGLLVVMGFVLALDFTLVVNTALLGSLGVLALLAGMSALVLTRRYRTRAVSPGSVHPASSSQHVGASVLGRDSLGHGFIYMVTALLTAAGQQLDRFVIELLATTEAVGVYSSTQNVMNIVTYAMLALMSLLLPAIAEWQAGSLPTEDFVRRCRLMSRALTALALAVVVVCVFGGDLLLSVFGPEFVAGRDALVVLAVGQVVTAALGVATTVLSIGDHRLVALWITAGSVVLNIVLCFLLIPIGGITGAAVATAVSQSSNRLAGHLYLKRRLGVSVTAW